MTQKTLRILLTPEVCKKKNRERISRIIWDTFEHAGITDCIDKDGNLPIDIKVGRGDNKCQILD